MSRIISIPNHTDPSESSKFNALVRKDYDRLLKNIRLATTEGVRELLLQQTVVGHALSGHAVFGERRVHYPNVSIEDVFSAINENPEELLASRKEIIDRIFRYVDRALGNKKNDKRLKDDQGGLAGINLPGAPKIRNALDVLRGMYLGEKVDNFEWRAKVDKRYEADIGGGESFVINRRALKSSDLTLQHLSNGPATLRERVSARGLHVNGQSDGELISDLVTSYEGDGIIVPYDGDGEVVTSPDHVIGYLRFKPGKGISDDSAFINAGILYGMDVAWGVFLADAVDTWDKAVPIHVRGGWDGHLAAYIEKEFASRGLDLNFKEDEIINFIYLCSKTRFGKPKRVPDSSQRYFLQNRNGKGKGEKRKSCAVKNHVHFIRQVEAQRAHFERHGEFPSVRKERKEYLDMLLGHSRVPSGPFYRDLIKHYKKELRASVKRN